MGRILIATIGSVTVGVFFFIGRRFFSPTIGLISAAILSTTFLHVSESHYIKDDVLALFFASLGLYALLALNESGRFRAWVWAGILLGLATAAKWFHALWIIPFCLVGIWTRWSDLKLHSRWWQWWGAGLLSWTVGFALLTPCVILDLRGLLEGIRGLDESNLHPWVSSEGQPPWLFYLTEHIRNGFGFPIEVAGIIGLPLFVRRYDRRAIIILIFPVVFYVFYLSRGTNMARYAIALLPAFALVSADFAVTTTCFLCRKRRSQAILYATWCAILIGPGMINSLRYIQLLRCPDTRASAKEWINMHVSEGSLLAVEGHRGFEGTSTLGPAIRSDCWREELSTKLRFTNIEDSSYLSIMRCVQNRIEEPTYHLVHSNRLDRQRNIWLDIKPTFIVTTSWALNDMNERRMDWFENLLQHRYELISTFSPEIRFRWDFYNWRIDYKALSNIWLGQLPLVGPEICIYRALKSHESELPADSRAEDAPSFFFEE